MLALAEWVFFDGQLCGGAFWVPESRTQALAALLFARERTDPRPYWS